MKTAHDLVIQRLHELIDVCWAARIEHERAMDIIRAIARGKDSQEALAERARRLIPLEGTSYRRTR